MVVKVLSTKFLNSNTRIYGPVASSGQELEVFCTLQLVKCGWSIECWGKDFALGHRSITEFH